MSRTTNPPPARVASPNTPRDRRRNAFTLLELVLVLMLMVIVAGLAVPSLSRSIAGHRLRTSGDMIRTEWTRARSKAMKSGRIHVVQYQAGGDQFQTQPWIAADDLLEASSQALMSQSQNATMPAPASGLAAQPERLPEGVLFVDSQATPDTRAQLVAAQAPMPTATGGVWSEPLLFYPDGTTSTAQLTLQNRRGRRTTIELRGLTGVSRVAQTPAGEVRP